MLAPINKKNGVIMRLTGFCAMTLAVINVVGCSTLNTEQHVVSGKVQVSKSLSGHQCGDTGMNVDQLKSQLEEQKIQVYSQAVTSDGLLYPQVCGAPDGRIAVFTINKKEQDQAVELGFKLYPTTKS